MNSFDSLGKRPLLTSAGWLCFALSLLGCLAVFNATFHLNSPYQFVAEQVLWIFPATMLLIVATRCSQKWLWRLMPASGVAVCVAMWLAPVYGVHVNGVFPWFSLWNVRIQVAEFGKPVFALFIAWVLHKTDKFSDDWLGGFTPLACGFVLWVLPMLVNPAPGAVVVYAVAFLTLILCSTRPVKQVVAFSVLALCLFVFTLQTTGAQHASATMAVSQKANTWQPEQFQRALATGGLFGKSLGHGTWSQFNLPPSHHDSVLAALGETLGLAGLLPLFLLLLAWVIHGWQQARRQINAIPLHAYAIVVLTALPAAQAFVHLSASLGIAPSLVAPLPLFSHGGSSLIATFAMVGLVENLRR